MGFVRKWRALSCWKKRWELSWAELVRMRLTLSERKEREKSFCVGPVKRKIVASSHKIGRQIGILLFWVSRTRVVAMTLRRQGEMGRLYVLGILERSLQEIKC